MSFGPLFHCLILGLLDKQWTNGSRLSCQGWSNGPTTIQFVVAFIHPTSDKAPHPWLLRSETITFRLSAEPDFFLATLGGRLCLEYMKRWANKCL
jgi:hypothetical protein